MNIKIDILGNLTIIVIAALCILAFIFITGCESIDEGRVDLRGSNIRNSGLANPAYVPPPETVSVQMANVHTVSQRSPAANKAFLDQRARAINHQLAIMYQDRMAIISGLPKEFLISPPPPIIVQPQRRNAVPSVIKGAATAGLAGAIAAGVSHGLKYH